MSGRSKKSKATATTKEISSKPEQSKSTNITNAPKQAGPNSGKKQPTVNAQNQGTSANKQNQAIIKTPQKQASSSNEQNQASTSNPQKQETSPNKQNTETTSKPPKQPNATNKQNQPNTGNTQKQATNINSQKQAATNNSQKQAAIINAQKQKIETNAQKQAAIINAQKQKASTSINSPSQKSATNPLNPAPVDKTIPNKNSGNQAPSSTSRPEKKVTNNIIYYTDKKAQLGKGGSSTVYEGYFEVPTRKAAVKVCDISYVTYSAKSKELETLRKLANNCPNIVGYFATEDISDKSYIVMELAKFTLEHAILNEKTTTDMLQQWCTNATNGLMAMHAENILHRDIKPANILIFENNIAKLADFGISRVIQSDTKGAPTDAVLGTGIWMPPEALRVFETDQKFVLFKNFDIFSLGLTIFFTMTKGRHLFSAGNDGPVKIISNIINYTPNWPTEIKCTSLCNLLKAMVNKKPKLRPDASVALEHPFFWDNKKRIDFLWAVTSDLKNATKAMDASTCKTEITQTHDRFCNSSRTDKNWRLRLCQDMQDFMTWKDKNRADKSKLPLENKKYGNSLLKLVEFIRDYREHYKDWNETYENGKLKMEKVFGADGAKYVEYFLTKFPEMVTILYTIFQDEKYRGVHLKPFYALNKACFEKW
ncbi:probable serine/threonine-protein kinase irlA [Folsomia candida]|uniref:Serine/threonine-protein kinase/endoribonuclease ire-1 n=1 Tax=Folsomia candida TaxID=158441 RepID=A0A226D3E1_FOLCA|nr:probable serine/threonine-protein kinase irlA [Folsomia candida]XP_035716786.1 probable serine/threonine-protein kinase irlA [Folsomia candida]OXA39739.1 Serine/threonine-protein kinase/endoribonuclease ire-1 [Folsomia candida]